MPRVSNRAASSRRVLERLLLAVRLTFVNEPVHMQGRQAKGNYITRLGLLLTGGDWSCRAALGIATPHCVPT